MLICICYHILYVCMYTYIYMYIYIYLGTHVVRIICQEESFLSFCLVGSRGWWWTWGVRLGSKHLYLMSHLKVHDFLTILYGEMWLCIKVYFHIGRTVIVLVLWIVRWTSNLPYVLFFFEIMIDFSDMSFCGHFLKNKIITSWQGNKIVFTTIDKRICQMKIRNLEDLDLL